MNIFDGVDLAQLFGAVGAAHATCCRYGDWKPPLLRAVSLLPRDGAELGAEGGAAEAEDFGGAGLEAADFFHYVGEDEGVEPLD